MIIDNATGKVLDEAISKLPTRAERTASYHARMDALTDPRYAPWPSDGQPGDMGDRVRAMMRVPPNVRGQWGLDAKYSNGHGALTADELEGLNQIGG